MSDVATREAAIRRAEADPGLVERLAGDVRRIAREIAHRHPDGAQAVGNVMHLGIDAASHCEKNSAEQVLTIEALHRSMLKLEAEAVAEDARRFKADIEASFAQRAALTQGGCVSVSHREGAIISAGHKLGSRLQALQAEIGGQPPEAAFLDNLDSLESDARSFIALLGAARRAARLRVSAEAARHAVASVAKAA